MKKAVALISRITPQELKLDQGGFAVHKLEIEGKEFELLFDDIEVVRTPREGMAVSEQDGIVVALNTELNDELIMEGLAREFVNKVQNMRKEMDLEVTQRIQIVFSSDEAVGTAVARYRDYIQAETLALSCEMQPDGAENCVERDLNGHACFLSIRPDLPERD
jgi:isoleucyl-tRNA synthetase